MRRTPAAKARSAIAHASLAAHRAAAAYRRAVSLDPLNPARAYQLARALDKAGKREDALAAYQSVLRLWRRDAGEHAAIAQKKFLIFGRRRAIARARHVDNFFFRLAWHEPF